MAKPNLKRVVSRTDKNITLLSRSASELTSRSAATRMKEMAARLNRHSARVLYKVKRDRELREISAALAPLDLPSPAQKAVLRYSNLALTYIDGGPFGGIDDKNKSRRYAAIGVAKVLNNYKNENIANALTPSPLEIARLIARQMLDPKDTIGTKPLFGALSALIPAVLKNSRKRNRGSWSQWEDIAKTLGIIVDSGNHDPSPMLKLKKKSLRSEIEQKLYMEVRRAAIRPVYTQTMIKKAAALIALVEKTIDKPQQPAVIETSEVVSAKPARFEIVHEGSASADVAGDESLVLSFPNRPLIAARKAIIGALHHKARQVPISDATIVNDEAVIQTPLPAEEILLQKTPIEKPGVQESAADQIVEVIIPSQPPAQTGNDTEAFVPIVKKAKTAARKVTHRGPRRRPSTPPTKAAGLPSDTEKGLKAAMPSIASSVVTAAAPLAVQATAVPDMNDPIVARDRAAHITSICQETLAMTREYLGLKKPEPVPEGQPAKPDRTGDKRLFEDIESKFRLIEQEVTLTPEAFTSMASNALGFLSKSPAMAKAASRVLALIGPK